MLGVTAEGMSSRLKSSQVQKSVCQPGPQSFTQERGQCVYYLTLTWLRAPIPTLSVVFYSSHMESEYPKT